MASPIKSDKWTTKDLLGFDNYIEVLESIIRDKQTETPLIIGIHGSWGSGKTSLMKMLADKLESDHICIWFNPWKYEKSEVLWRALLLAILAKMEEKNFEPTGKDKATVEDLELTLYRDIERIQEGRIRIDLKKFGRGVIDLGLSLAPIIGRIRELPFFLRSNQVRGVKSILDAVNRERVRVYKNKISSFEQFERRFGELITFIGQKTGRVIIFLDDLDRCLPEKAIEILESIKLYFEANSCIFVIGADLEIIEKGVMVKYRQIIDTLMHGPYDDEYREMFKEALTKEYVEKIIQLPVSLNPIEDPKRYVEGIAKEIDYERNAKWIGYGSGWNPRRVKRILNMFLFHKRLATKTNQQVDEKELGWITALMYKHPREYRALKGEPLEFDKLVEIFRKENDR